MNNFIISKGIKVDAIEHSSQLITPQNEVNETGTQLVTKESARKGNINVTDRSLLGPRGEHSTIESKQG